MGKQREGLIIDDYYWNRNIMQNLNLPARVLLYSDAFFHKMATFKMII